MVLPQKRNLLRAASPRSAVARTARGPRPLLAAAVAAIAVALAFASHAGKAEAATVIFSWEELMPGIDLQSIKNTGLSQVLCGAGGGGEELCEGSGHFA